jgi:hypothetical protein
MTVLGIGFNEMMDEEEEEVVRYANNNNEFGGEIYIFFNTG